MTEPLHQPHTVLVAYATRHGSTAQVAEAVATELRTSGLEVDVLPVGSCSTLDAYDGVVLGTALYTGRAHPDARRFLRRFGQSLASRPFAVFALGPKTLEPADVAHSRAQLDAALARSNGGLAPASVAIFGGVIDPAHLRFPFSRMPASDARDWAAVRAWAREVAERFDGWT